MTVRTNYHQQEFFEQLAAHFPSKGKMIESMSELLHVGRDAIYRRLRGETVLSAEEIITLARQFNISLDPPSQQDVPIMYYPSGATTVSSEVDFFRNLQKQSELLSSLPNVTVDYATPELPLFYELYTPNLLAYKVFVYGVTSWDLEKWKGVEFRPELIDPEVQRIANELVNAFFNFPGRELWSIGILDISLRSIEHGVEVGYLKDREIIEKIFEELNFTIRHMEAMTKAGKRFAPNSTPDENSPDFRVFHNELTNTNNVIIITSDVQSVVYTTFVNPNFLVSMDDRIHQQMQTWFNNLVESSNAMDVNAGKYMTTFFNRLRKKVEDTKLRVEVLSGLF